MMIMRLGGGNRQRNIMKRSGTRGKMTLLRRRLRGKSFTKVRRFAVWRQNSNKG
jgi:hypothetical protein